MKTTEKCPLCGKRSKLEADGSFYCPRCEVIYTPEALKERKEQEARS